MGVIESLCTLLHLASVHVVNVYSRCKDGTHGRASCGGVFYKRSIGKLLALRHSLLFAFLSRLFLTGYPITLELEPMLDPQLLLNNGGLLLGEGGDWPYNAAELHNTIDVRLKALDGFIYRMHRFGTCASSIKGLTADILLCAVVMVVGAVEYVDVQLALESGREKWGFMASRYPGLFLLISRYMGGHLHRYSHT
ncbi:hypothetical protein M405DRAFT_881960 [Rhizopogon salebrosus TDB-379]|nr:hypothetical protein M405DRAFT_881960 [Rhizopogon salebrosus TDB-379]